VPEQIGQDDNAVIPFRAGETLRWRLMGWTSQPAQYRTGPGL